MTPFLFITTAQGKTQLRDFVQDLNQEMNFDDIVKVFYKAFTDLAKKPKTNEERYISNLLQIHSKKEMLRIIAENLRRLNVEFSHVKKESISGAWVGHAAAAVSLLLLLWYIWPDDDEEKPRSDPNKNKDDKKDGDRPRDDTFDGLDIRETDRIRRSDEDALH